MLSRDFVGGLVAIALGSLYLVFSFRQRVSALADTIGPAGMPKVLGILMVALGIILCATGCLSIPVSLLRRHQSEWEGEARKIFAGIRAAWHCSVIYLFLLACLGYVFSIALLLAAVAFYLGAACQLANDAVIAAAGAVVLWAIFVVLLGVPMPAGTFFSGLIWTRYSLLLLIWNSIWYWRQYWVLPGVLLVGALPGISPSITMALLLTFHLRIRAFHCHRLIGLHLCGGGIWRIDSRNSHPHSWHQCCGGLGY